MGAAAAGGRSGVAGTTAAAGGSAGARGNDTRPASMDAASRTTPNTGGMTGEIAASGDTSAAASGIGGASTPAQSSTFANFGIDDSQGWVLTVYHTPVETFHRGAPMQVTGCAQLSCVNGQDDDLGTYPSDFIQAAKDEGTGRIASGKYAGRYLNWSIDIGYWLDDAPRDGRGQALIPWVSAAADPKVPWGTHFVIADCGVDEAQRTPIDQTVCKQIEQAKWSVNDRFTVGSVGAQFDLYIGEEDRENFDDDSPYSITTAQAKVTLTP
jgi:hypothetical protein